MMEDFRIKTSWRTSRKRRRLKRLLGADGVLAIEDLWSYCAAERTTGDLSGLTDADIEDEVEWCSEGDLVPSLVECGLLDGEPGSYQIHDWGEHNPYVATGNPRSERASKAAHARWHKGKRVSSCIYCTDNAQAMPKQCPSNAQAMPIPETALPKSESAMPLPSYLPTLLPTNPPPTQPDTICDEPATPTETKLAKVKPKPEQIEGVDEVVAYYRQQHPTRGKQLKPGHRDYKLIRARLEEGSSVDDLKRAVDGNLIDDWHRTNGKHSVEFVFRNNTKVEDFIATANGPVKIDRGEKMNRSLSALDNYVRNGVTK